MEIHELKKMLLEFGHWAALGVAGVVVLSVLIFTGDAKSDKLQDSSLENLDKLEKAMRANILQQEELPNYESKILANWKPISIANSALFKAESWKDIARFISRLRDAKDQEPILVYLRNNLSKNVQQQIKNYKNGDTVSSEFLDAFHKDLNLILAQINPEDTNQKLEPLYSQTRFEKQTIRPQLVRMVTLPLPQDELVRMNRWLLEDALSDEIVAYRRVGQDYFYEETQFKFQHGKAPIHQWILIPQNLSLKIDREKIDITWEPPVTEIDPKTGKEKELTSIDGYYLLKRWEENGKKQSQQFTFDGMASTTYEDKDVKTKVDYYYQVRAYTLNTKAQGGKQEILVDDTGKPKLDEKDQKIQVVVSDYCPEQRGTILPSYQIFLTGVAGKELAFIRMEKWQKGKWRSNPHQVKKGQKIEFQGFDREINEIIEYTPGWVLTDIKTVWVDEEKTKKVMKTDPKTGLILYGPDRRPLYEDKIVTIRIPKTVIVYRDENGKETVVYQETKSSKE